MRNNDSHNKAHSKAVQGLLCASAGFFLAMCPAISQAFVQETLGPGVPVAIEKQFICDTTTQYKTQLTVNPLAANTYSIKLLGVNPNYNPPATNQQLLDSILTLSTATFVYGFADGMTYQQTKEEGSIGFLGNLCGSATWYNLIQTTAQTFDKGTCQDVISTIENQFYAMSLSTPTPIPPQP